jgi:DNA recombination protein RmuC
MEIVLLIVGIISGCLIGFFVAKSSSSKLGAQLAADHEKYELSISQLKDNNSSVLSDRDKQIVALGNKIDILNGDIRQLTSAKVQAETEKKSLEKRLEEQAANLDKQFQQMKEQFRNIATSVIKDNTSDISKLNTETIRNIIDPFKEQMDKFRDKVDQCYVDEAKERFSLQEEIKRLVEANQKIGEDATNLATALKGNSKIQGDWGEMILDDILLKSGLKDGIHYHKQEYTRDEAGRVISNDEGNKMRTDVIVDFPDGRKMIIDSKVSLTAYANCMNAESKDLSDRYLKEHLKSVTDHIDELTRVDYSRYINDAPDFVMMFIPNEPAYYLAIKANPNLWNYAYDRKVVLMNPTNLITALRLSLDLWRRDDQIKNLDKIVQTASSLYDKVVLFQESMDKIGSNISALDKAYEEAAGRFSTGKGNMLTTTQKLMKFGITPKKKLSVASAEDEDKEIE